MDISVEVELRIEKSAHDVFEAIIDPIKMAHYFISSGSGRLEPNRTVEWAFADAGARGKVMVHDVDIDHRVTFSWPVAGRDRLVEIELLADSAATEVKIREGVYDAADINEVRSFGGQTGGWMNILCCLKAYLEHDINLRAGMITRGIREKVAQDAAASRR
jgi:uncharacterized protein YndB with AHSA1/START domain